MKSVRREEDVGVVVEIIFRNSKLCTGQAVLGRHLVNMAELEGHWIYRKLSEENRRSVCINHDF